MLKRNDEYSNPLREKDNSVLTGIPSIVNK